MTAPTSHPAAEEYLRTVDRLLDRLPPGRQEEIVEALREHIEVSIEEAPDAGEAYVRSVLDRLGHPADVAAAAYERFGYAPAPAPASAPAPVAAAPVVAPPTPGRWPVIIGLMLTTFGSVFLPVIGWLVGIVLICASDIVRRGHKVLALMLFPLGVLPALQLMSVEIDTRGNPGYCGDMSTPALRAQPGCAVEIVGASPWPRVIQVVAILISALGPFVTAYVISRDLRRQRG